MTASLLNTTNPPSAVGVDQFVNPPFITAQRVPATGDIYPPGTRWMFVDGATRTIYETTGAGSWSTEGANAATTTTYGTVLLTDNSEPVATKAYADALAIAGSPVATTTTAGIGELATDAEAIAGTPSTGLLALFVTPSNLSPVFASPPAIGGTVAAAGTFTDLTADGTGAVSLGSATAGDFTVATGDLSLIGTAGSVVINGGEAVDDAIQLTSAAGGLAASFAKSAVIASTETNADSVQLTSAGGMDITATGAAGKDVDIVCTSGSINITAGENAANSIVITSSIGGIDITAASASAGEDIDITATGSSVNVTSTENAALAIFLHADGGTSETIVARADQGTGDASVQLLSDVGGITLTGGKAAATAINFTTSDAAGGITATAGTGGILPTTTGAFTVVSTKNAAQSIELHANGGTSETIRIRADQGTAVTSLDLLSDVGGITLNAGLAAANSIRLIASAAGGGMDLDCGTAGFTLDTTGALSLDAAGTTNLTTTGAFDLTVNSTLGSIVITGGEAAVDAVQINASDAAGGIDINCGTGGATLDSTGAISIDAAGASNFTTSSGDLSLIASTNSVVITGAEAAVDAVQINASNAAGGIDVNAGTGGVTVDTTAAISLDSATASNFTVTGAADLTLSSSAGAVNVTSGEANADSINVTSGGGMNIVATGAAAKDTIITNTNGSITITAGESVTDAFNLTASGAASRMTLTAGTGAISIASGQIVKVTSVATAASPYSLLGTDFFVACDATGGAMTITLPASPTTGRYVIVSDSVGQAGANTITIDGNGKNISLAATSAATKTITTAYKAVGLIYNGTIWNAFALA